MTDNIKKIAFQGELGAYSHLALKSFFKNAEPIATLNFKQAMDFVRNHKADAAMIPVENSQWGRVSDVHFLLPKTELRITHELFHRVHHKLLGVKGANLSDITHVRSHPQALGQCAEKINTLNIIPISTYDTAGSAKIIAKHQDKTQAAIASELAAEIYNLDILQSNFEDNENNVTRFLVMQRNEHVTELDINDPAIITSFLFTTRNIPASLYKVLGGFATNDVNIIRIESYVNADNFTSSSFYAEIYGHYEKSNIKRAFDELCFFATNLKILGSFKANIFRK